jgi:YfiH family protein
VSTADCIPVLLYDEAHHAAAAIHAGWRGTVKRIVKKTVEAMGERFGTNPEELKAVVGPGISLEAFEVGDEVYEQFQDAGFPMAQIARRYAKWHIDLPACNRLLLEETGVHRIEMSGICTYQQSGDYFSARKLGVDSGRILTGIVLR